MNIIVSIDPITHVVTFTAPANWFGQETITFRATDLGGLWDEDATTVTVTSLNDPPVASGLAISPPSPVTEDDLVGSYTYYDLEGDPEIGTEIRWYKDSVLQPAYNDMLTIPSNETANGQAWYFTVRPKDGMDFGDLQASPTVVIGNIPPEASNLAISPSFPYTTDDLVGNYTYYDADGDPEFGSEIRWYKDGLLQSAFNDNLTVPSSATAKGQAWYFTVKPKDGTDFGALQTSPSVTIQNSPPSIGGVNITPDPAYTDDTLTATPYGWYDADGDPEGYIYQWQKWDGANWQDISGETSNTLSSDNFVKEDQIKINCTPFDGEDYGTSKEDTITISNSPPSPAPVVDITPDFPFTTDDLVCTIITPSIDPDGDTVTYTYEWYKNDVLQSDLTTVTTDLSVTLDSSNTHKGEVWKCVVTPYGSEPGPPGSDQSTIQNSPPVLDQIGNKTVDEETELSFTATASDPDMDPLTFSLGPGAPPGAVITSDGYFTWTPTEAQGPSLYYINITVSDSIDIDYEVIEVTVNEVNVAPVLDPIGDKSVDELATLSFTATASDTDIPPQTLTFSLGVGAPSGATITAAGAFTWTPTEAEGPGNFVIRIIVSDGIDQDYEDITVTVNEVNRPPVLNPIGPKTVSEGDLLQFTVTASDPDIPTQTLIYSASNLPPGATFNPTTRVFSWTPSSGQAGVYPNVHFVVSDGYLTDSEDITITVTTEKPPPPPVGGYAAPIDKSHLLAPTIGLAPRIGLALTLLAAMVVTVILIRRRNKTF